MQSQLCTGLSDSSSPPNHSPTVAKEEYTSRTSTSGFPRSDGLKTVTPDRLSAQAGSRLPQANRRSIGPALRASPRFPRDVGWRSRLPRRVGELVKLYDARLRSHFSRSGNAEILTNAISFDTSFSAHARQDDDRAHTIVTGHDMSLKSASHVHLRFPSEHGRRMFQDLVTKTETGTDHRILRGKSGCDSHDASLEGIAGEYTPIICDEPAVHSSLMQELRGCTLSSIPHAAHEPRIKEHRSDLPASNRIPQDTRVDSLMSVHQLSTVAPSEACASTTPKTEARRGTPLINPRPQQVRLQDIRKDIARLVQAFPGPTPPDEFPYGHFLPELVIRSKTTPPETIVKPRREHARRYSYSASSTPPDRSNSGVAQDANGTQGPPRDRKADLTIPNTSKVTRQAKRRKRKASNDTEEVDDQDGIPESGSEDFEVAQGFRCVHYYCNCENKHRGCETSHKNLSGTVRHHGAPHGFFYCTKCFKTLRDKKEKKEHKGCTQKCVTSGCPNRGTSAGNNPDGITPCLHGKPNKLNSPTEQWKELYRMAHNGQEPPEIFVPMTALTRRQSSFDGARPSCNTDCTSTMLQIRSAELEELLSAMWTYLEDPKVTNVRWETISNLYNDYWSFFVEKLSPSKTDTCSGQRVHMHKVVRLEDLVETIWKMINNPSSFTPGDRDVYQKKVMRFLGEEQKGDGVASSSRVMQSQAQNFEPLDSPSHVAPVQGDLQNLGTDTLGSFPDLNVDHFESFLTEHNNIGDHVNFQNSSADGNPPWPSQWEVPADQPGIQPGLIRPPPAFSPHYEFMQPDEGGDLSLPPDNVPNKDHKGKRRAVDSAYESAGYAECKP